MLSLTHIVDREYYLERYPDVATQNMDPVEHYFFHGVREGRSPNRLYGSIKRRAGRSLLKTIGSALKFDEEFYRTRYPDVSSAGIDPLVHYVRFGFLENRQPNQSASSGMTTRTMVAAALASLTGRQSNVWPKVRRDYFFWSAKRGCSLATDVLAMFERRLSMRQSRTTFVRALPVANVVEAKFDWASVRAIEPAKLYSFFEPEIFGEETARVLRTVEVPSKWIVSMSDATVVGGFQVVAHDHLVLYEPAGNPHNDFVAGSWPFVTGIRNRPAAAVWYEYDNRETIPEGILLSGRCSPNYYHWLIEYLARIYSVLPVSELRNVPLIVDGAMFPQELESLWAICPNWPIFPLRRGTLLQVSRLHIPSIPTFLPDTLEIPFWQGSALCTSTLSYLRETIFARYGIERVEPSRKIFLSRRGARSIINSEEVEALLEEHGFECVDTATLAFEEQVRLFAESKMIVGPLGAAFTNLIFCMAGCRVLGLATPFGKRFCIQANLAGFAGCDYKIVAGEHPMYKPGDEHTLRDVELMHLSFSVNIETLGAALLSWE
ncbi:glycosyltransferase family 61 protein [Paraburkholderia sp. SOS3]|uniref:glycosyltransferase family 61 protein n=1 Tax=Paraburkholderia sp. SOS3 TaxID=1926494 RepID=UPI0018DC96DA|nr:glycosyltransferase family 61 protein [Paraburkholderia sp. SOS3]